MVKKCGWQNSKFCRDYLKRIEISTDDVHYGYLSPGESDLMLLGDKEKLRGLNALEIGCGSAQNCIAMSKFGLRCTGVDVSEEMLCQARVLAKKENVKIDLVHGDAKNLLKLFPEKALYAFHVFVSSYAIGFICRNLADLFCLLLQIRELSAHEAKLVFCLTHPCQINGLKCDTNNEWNETIFPEAEVSDILRKSGFFLEQKLEQITVNPSLMLASEAQKYPYRPLNLERKLDVYCNQPHTIIYSARAK